MANRDPEPESAHQQFSDEYLEKQKKKATEEAVTDSTTPYPGSFFDREGEKSGKK